ncbi:MAG: M20/M25/M40 family metallo-hydrolase, partial [Clostridia bacterium]|nr:M20/M25/M40 family metallo-hydrolase [Clostridia bacterium]
MKTLLKTLCEANGAGGNGTVTEVIAAVVRPLVDDVTVDPLGSVIAVKRCKKEHAPLLMLEAHIDEIGFIVTDVDDDGFVRVAKVGGIDSRVLAATEVVLHADKDYLGVFCSTPPHLQKGDEKLKPISEMGIDIGLTAKEAKAAIQKGTRGTYRPVFRELSDTRVCVKALDDRCGCAALVWALRLLQDETLDCDVAALFAVQEEIGGGGAQAGAFATRPDVAIATDVSFAATPDAPPHKCGKLGGGVMLGLAPGLDSSWTKKLTALARAHEIPLQYEVMGERTGTDADSITTARGGVKTALLSIPQRYMHTPVEVVDVRDVEAVGKLMALAAKEGM